MTADGEVVGEVDNYTRPSKVLAAMKKVFKDRPEFAKETEAEAGLEGIARAELRFDLGDDAGAAEILEKLEGAEAAYLRGRIARFARDWDRMERSFAAIRNEKLAADVRMERAHRNWQERDFEALLKAAADFPKDSRRYTEARHYEGLAHFFLGRKDRALETWKETIDSRPQDAWIYRADGLVQRPARLALGIRGRSQGQPAGAHRVHGQPESGPGAEVAEGGTGRTR